MPLWHQDAAQRLPVMPWAVQQAVAGPGAAPPPLDARGTYRLAMPAADAWPAQRRFVEVAEVALGQHDAALREAVHGRVVFIGSSALLADAVMTPQGQTSGTMALAQAYAAFNQGSWVRPPAPALDALLLLLALLPGLVTVARPPGPGARHAGCRDGAAGDQRRGSRIARARRQPAPTGWRRWRHGHRLVGGAAHAPPRPGRGAAAARA
ncbi:MAG: CHASE2 domain-containing protein [Rubrivivax sp.]